MTDKEILAELKESYEYLQDIRENGCEDHCAGQIRENIINKLEVAMTYIEDIYEDFYNTLDKEDLRVNCLEKNDNNKVYIASFVGGDYETNESNNNYFTCGDADYYWYQDKEFIISGE